MQPANFHESQLIDAGGGNFGLKLHLPAEAPFADLGMVESPAGSGQWRLPLYEGGAIAPDGDYWLILRPTGVAYVLPVADRDVHNLGSFGFFRKDNGVAFVTPHNEPWPTSSFGYVYAQK